MRKGEEVIFGSTARQARLQVRALEGPAPTYRPFGRERTAEWLAEAWGDPSLETQSRLTIQGKRGELGSNPIHYLGFGPVTKGEISRGYLPPGEKAKIELRWGPGKLDKGLKDMFQRALWAWLNLGGIGAKSRKGFGSLRSLDVNRGGSPATADPDLSPGDRETLAKQAGALLASTRGKNGGGLAWTHVSESTRVFLAAQEYETWEEAMEQLGAWLIGFRRRYGHRNDQRPGVAGRDYEWAAPKGTDPKGGFPDRAGFGLPLPFTRNVFNPALNRKEPKGETVIWGTADQSGREAREREKESRRASPLLLHVNRLGEGSYLSVLTWMPFRIPSRERPAEVQEGSGIRFSGHGRATRHRGPVPGGSRGERTDRGGPAVSGETALLTFGIGPVHTFIAQARRVADVWAGSDLLSHLIRQAMSEVHRDDDCEVVFPYLPKGANIPDGVPNRFVCRVPAGRAEAMAKAMRDRVQGEWDRVVRAAVEVLRPYKLAPGEGLRNQAENLLTFAWSWVAEGGEYAQASREGAIRFAASRLFRPFAPAEEIGEKCAICGERTALPDGDRGRVRDFWRDAERTASAKHKRFLREDQGRLCLVCASKRFHPLDLENDQTFDAFDAFQPDADKPYFALVMMDGDRMGETLSLGKEKIVEGRVEEFHRAVSEALTGFASGLRTEAKKGAKDAAALNLSALGGYRAEGRAPQLIYAGGDDVLLVCDARDAIPLAQRLQARCRRPPYFVTAPRVFSGLQRGWVDSSAQ